MLTQEILLALLQGLPADHLDHLDRPWFLLATRIARGLKEGLDPPSALHAALDNSAEWERQVYLRAFLVEAPVLAISDLTQRQKEALIALRYAGACSLRRLVYILGQDRSNARRRLDLLVEKGYAIKYFRPDGANYLAISSPLPNNHRSESFELWDAFKKFVIDEYGGDRASSLSDLHRVGDLPTQLIEESGSNTLTQESVDGPASPTQFTQSTQPTRHTHTTRESGESSPICSLHPTHPP